MSYVRPRIADGKPVRPYIFAVVTDLISDRQHVSQLMFLLPTFFRFNGHSLFFEPVYSLANVDPALAPSFVLDLIMSTEELKKVTYDTTGRPCLRFDCFTEWSVELEVDARPIRCEFVCCEPAVIRDGDD
eukprot:gnl/Hemi2/25744_TR8649_c0_g1_i2.p2 gnl/Hemi2/25744_TR8649_c0_g1~~gnl/Hemi2/25744_TR8649_c0_g1_i2.p2  ORF type:complete len:130 (+),score=18.19 gnl/Hemi2/25744_TR8649_c0_g1_i2:120-509(+)